MDNYTLSCTNEDCYWEEDHQFDHSDDAKDYADSHCCQVASCGCDLKVYE